MKIINATLIALTVAASSVTSAYAHTEFRERDSLQSAGGVDAYYPNGDEDHGPLITIVTPQTHLNGAERAIVHQNMRDPK